MNTFGNKFRISIFGESHGPAIGITIDGCPPGIPLGEQDFVNDLSRRKPGIPGTTSRVEDDTPRIISGIFNGHTTGSPLTIVFENNDVRSSDYDQVLSTPRPGHADFVAMKRYRGFNDHRGGGHFSGRLTLGIVAAGVIAKKIISPVVVNARLIAAGGSENIQEAIASAMDQGDSIGGLLECVAKKLPLGLGEPFFDSVESLISHIVFAIPAIKGIEFGSGFMAAQMKGSHHNDAIIDQTGKTKTNNAGGITGGLTNGNDLVFRVAVKPTSSISVAQQTLDLNTLKEETLQVKGRHDACIALRVPVVLEAATAIALADLILLERIS
jgi:chorismate synthase